MKRTTNKEKLKARETKARQLQQVSGGEVIPAANQKSNISWAGGVGEV
jgi:hypothetical protein